MHIITAPSSEVVRLLSSDCHKIIEQRIAFIGRLEAGLRGAKQFHGFKCDAEYIQPYPGDGDQ